VAAARENRIAVVVGLMLLALLALAGAPLGEARTVMDEGGEYSIPSSPPIPRDPEAQARWIDNVVLPIPSGVQPSLSSIRAQGAAGWSNFRAPFPPVPVWDPPGPKRVGLQAGHWLYDEAPDELADLRSNPGTSGGGVAEWQVTLDIARRTASLLRAAGVEVDVLPTTIPIRYRANIFVSIHADGDNTGMLNGFKVGRPGFSSIPSVDDRLAETLSEEYEAATGLVRHDEQVSLRMRWYYAFNARRYQHAVAPGVPQAIIETGFLSSYLDRRVLIGDPDLAARGIADGILRFLRWESQEGE
jgi:N-acetylmuramoyl-L-alanine amidase